MTGARSRVKRLVGSRGRTLAILLGSIAAVAGPAAPALAQSVAATELAATTTEVPQDTPQTRILDPFEPVNRGLFKIDGIINNFFAGKGRILATAR